MNSDNLRNSLSSLTNDLRSRKVLTIVGLLILVAVAIPLLLSHSGKAASLAALPPAPTVTTPATVAVISTTAHHTPARNALRRPAHNPFLTRTSTTPAAAVSTSANRSSASTGSSRSAAATGANSGPAVTRVSSPSSSPSPAVAPRTLTVTTPSRVITVIKTVTKAPPYTDYEAKVSMREDGAGSAPRLYNRLSRYQLLPSDHGAFASFIGIRGDRKTAVFVLAAGVEAAGQGRCAPSTLTCSFLTLEPGESVKLSAPVWAGSKTFTLRYAGVHLVTSSASVVNVDASGRSVVQAAAIKFTRLKQMRFAPHTGLLKIALGPTVPAVS